MYRVSPYENEHEKGSTYVTYLPPDRDMYRGSFANGIRNYYKLTSEDPLYEAVYKNKTDLNMPSSDVLAEVVEKVGKKNNSELLREISKNIVKTSLDKASKWADEFVEYSSKTPYPVTKKEAERLYWDNFGGKKKSVNQVLKEWEALTTDQLYRAASSRFGTERLYKEAVIQELKTMGYNAMIDQAGVGGKSRGIEGYSPIIVFDREEVLEKIGSSKVDTKVQKDADRRYMKWYRKVNSNPKRVAEWS